MNFLNLLGKACKRLLKLDNDVLVPAYRIKIIEKKCVSTERRTIFEKKLFYLILKNKESWTWSILQISEFLT